MKTPLQVAIERYRQQHPRGKLPRPLKMLFPNAVERMYRNRLQDRIALAKSEFRGVVVPALLTARRDSRFDSVNHTDIEEILQRYAGKLEVLFGEGTAATLASGVSKAVNDHNYAQFQRQFARLTPMDVLQFTPVMADNIAVAARQNATLIVDVGDDIEMRVSTAIRDGFLRGERWEGVIAGVENGLDGNAGVFQKASTRAALIARDQIATLNGSLTKDRNESLGISLYEWQTVGDARVRDAHRHLDGQTFSWSGSVSVGGKTYGEAPGGIFPGSEINCRCVASPVFIED